MINPVTGWFKIKQYNDKKSITVANIVEQEWLARYPRPYLITLDQGSEFIGQDFCDQMLGNLIRSFELQDNPYLDLDDPWCGYHPCSSFVCNVLNVSYHSSQCLASSYLGGI